MLYNELKKLPNGTVMIYEDENFKEVGRLYFESDLFWFKKIAGNRPYAPEDSEEWAITVYNRYRIATTDEEMMAMLES